MKIDKKDLPIEVRVNKAHLPALDIWEVEAIITGLKNRDEAVLVADKITEYFEELGIEMRAAYSLTKPN